MLLLAERNIAPAKWTHAAISTFWTDSDIKIPDCFQEIFYRQICVSAPELLISLQLEDQLQVFGFHPVIEKTIITDLLKTFREHVHQKTTDKLFVVQSDFPAWFTGFFPSCSKSGLCFSHGNNPAV